jgi:hypothetical protein
MSSLAVVGLSGSAGAAVGRYQITTLSYYLDLVVGDVHFTHSYTIYPDPCGSSFTGTGQYPALPGAASIYERLSGSTDYNTGIVSFTDTYLNPSTGLPTGYSYTFSGTFFNENQDVFGDIVATNGTFSGVTFVHNAAGDTSTNFKNHGAYVNSVPPSQRAAAANSCVGMPYQSMK